MSELTGYNLDAISEENADIIVARMLKMVKDNDAMFTCISDQIISDMILQDYIEIDLESENIEGTTLTKKGEKILIHDDVLATGGTAEAVCKLVEKLGGDIVQCNFIMQLNFLNGKEKIKQYEVKSVLEY